MKTVKNKYPKIHFNFNEMGILYALIIFWVIRTLYVRHPLTQCAVSV